MNKKVEEEGMEKKKYEGFTLFELLMSLVIIGIMMALLALPSPAQAFDLSKPLGLGDEKTLQVDVTLKAGRPFEADYSVTDEVENLNVSAREHEWYLRGVVGVKLFDVVRTYIDWESVTNIYAERKYGCEVLFPVVGLDAGVWAEYVNRTDFKIAQDKYGIAGVLVRF